jgi:hypothetical protein
MSQNKVPNIMLQFQDHYSGNELKKKKKWGSPLQLQELKGIF